MIHIGIDLGTTFSIVSHVNAQGVPTLFPDYHDANGFRTPSVVHHGEDGTLVGSALEELLDDDPGLPIVRFVKLQMGNKEPVYTDHRKKAWSAEAISALILRKMMKDVEAFSPEDVGAAVIAVPANFGDAQRQATRDAALMAGLNHVELVEEPIAAATFYGLSDARGEQTLFVYDLGGGTFDATVLQNSPEGLFELATDGSNHIGGKSIDEIIMKYIAGEFERMHHVNPMCDAESSELLRRFATETKLKLAKPGRGQVRKTLLLSGKTIDVLLTKNQLDKMIEPLIDETITISERCLAGAGLSWDMVDKVLLTGGSSLLPLVQDKIRKACNKAADSIICKQPHQAVAYGAALVADQRFGKQADDETGLVQQVCSYDLGLRIFDKSTGQPGVKTLIKRNSPLPSTSTTTFHTTRIDQSRMIIEAVQSKGDEETSLGFFAFGPIAHPRKNYPIEITISYDKQGIVIIRAHDAETGKQMEQVMEGEGQESLAQLAEQREWVRQARINE